MFYSGASADRAGRAVSKPLRGPGPAEPTRPARPAWLRSRLQPRQWGAERDGGGGRWWRVGAGAAGEDSQVPAGAQDPPPGEGCKAAGGGA